MRSHKIIIQLLFVFLFMHLLDARNVSSSSQPTIYQKAKNDFPDAKVYTIRELLAVYDSLKYARSLLPTRKSNTMYIED